jgi:hypothetical protein
VVICRETDLRERVSLPREALRADTISLDGMRTFKAALPPDKAGVLEEYLSRAGEVTLGALLEAYVDSIDEVDIDADPDLVDPNVPIVVVDRTVLDRARDITWQRRHRRST